MPAHAVDTKLSNGAICQPYSTTTLPSDLSFRAHGLKNISANAEYVVCNIEVDADTQRWSSTDEVLVTFHSPTASIPRCELYIGSNLAGATVSAMDQREFLAGEIDFLYLSGVPSGQVAYPSHLPGPPASLYCRMPPGTSLLQVMTVETEPTDSF